MSEFINTIDALGDAAVVDSIIDRSITEFNDDKLTSIGKSAFQYCTMLETVDIPNCTSCGVDIFAYCTGLTSVNLPNLSSVPTDNWNAFNNCRSLKNITLPLVKKVIGHTSFNGCSALEKADFATCTGFSGYSLFKNCASLYALILRSTANVASLYTANPCIGTPIASGTGYIYVPSALVDSYKAATNWSTYASQFRALEDYTVDGTVTGELDETKI